MPRGEAAMRQDMHGVRPGAMMIGTERRYPFVISRQALIPIRNDVVNLCRRAADKARHGRNPRKMPLLRSRRSLPALWFEGRAPEHYTNARTRSTRAASSALNKSTDSESAAMYSSSR